MAELEMNSIIDKENPKTVFPNPPLSEEEPSTSEAETLDSTSNAVVGVSRVHDPPPSGKDPPIRALSPEEEEEIDLAEKRETRTCKDGVACKDIDAGKEASEDIDSERQGIRDTDELENKAENAKGVVEIGAIENGNGEGEKVVQGNKADELDKDEDNREPDEADLVKPPPHWLPKACIRLAVAGGCISEEEVFSLLSTHGNVSSITFEDEKRDSAIIRFDCSSGDDILVSKIQENLHNTHLDNRTLHVEPFKVDSVFFVGNLTLNTDDSKLKKMFEPHGRVERAFVMKNLVGRSKGYGFVEYSLKSQATAAKKIMITVPMDGRLLRVEWSNCENVRDMFSSVLFVDRIKKLMVEASLRTLFEQYGKVKDLCLAAGANGVSRGFAFIDFFKSADADRAQEALDGCDFGGNNLRVSFANPSKSARVYKQRLASQAAPSVLGNIGREWVPAMQMPLLRGGMHLSFGGNLSPEAGQLVGLPGMGLKVQFNHGAYSDLRNHEQGATAKGSDVFVSGASRKGIMGQSPFLESNIRHRQGMVVSRGYAPLLQSSSQGAQSINSGAMAQISSVSNNTQQYQQISTQTINEAPYIQPSHNAQQLQQLNAECKSQTFPAVPVSNSAVPYPAPAQDMGHQQEPGSYYQEEQISQPANGGSQFMALVPGILSHGVDAQWYASQSTYQQQALSCTQPQEQQPLQTSMHNYSEQQSHYYQSSTYPNSVYQQATPTYSQQPPTSYQQPVAATSTYFQQPLAPYQQPVMADGCYQQQQPPLYQVSQVFDTNKRPRH